MEKKKKYKLIRYALLALSSIIALTSAHIAMDRGMSGLPIWVDAHVFAFFLSIFLVGASIYFDFKQKATKEYPDIFEDD